MIYILTHAERYQRYEIAEIDVSHVSHKYPQSCRSLPSITHANPNVASVPCEV